MKIRGTGSYTDTNGRSHTVLGVGELPDDEKLRELEVTGNFSFDKISCDEVNVSGKCAGGSIIAQNLNVSGGFSFDDVSCDEIELSGKCDGKSVNAKNFSASGKVEVDSLTVEQTLRLSGKPQIDSVTADKIIIGSRNGFIGSVKCRKIKIFDDAAQFDGEIFGNIFIRHVSFGQSLSRVSIKKIDAETVALENCAVEVIRCKDAFIGTNCAIKKLFVSGECTVADDSTVGETIRT